MTEVEKALNQISAIHEHLARTEVYRGLRSIPVALAGLVGMVAAVFQSGVLENRPADWFVYYWVGAAFLSFTVAMSGGVFHFLSKADRFHRRRSLHVVGQFLPCLVAGACLTLVLVRYGQPAIQLLPGLWSILFSLGTFATRSYLPHGIGWVALGYLIAGIILLRMAETGQSLSPWGMGLTFGGGNLAAAAVLYWSLERNQVDAQG
jgi:hypothetical protein